jgi:hypothetical protein
LAVNCFPGGIGGCWLLLQPPRAESSVPATRYKITAAGEKSKVHWWILIAIAVIVLLSLYGLFRWASAAPGIDVEADKEHFQAEQDWRGLRRSGIDPTAHRQH